jgi:hypothetical protein
MWFEADASDYSPGSWPARSGQSQLTLSGSPTLTSYDNQQCVLFNADDKWIEWDADINPSTEPILTLEATFYPLSIPNQYGWLFGDENGGCDRYLLIHDSRIGTAQTGPSCMQTEWNSQPIVLNQWNHMIAFYNQNTKQAYVYMNGVKSSVLSANHNNGNGRLRLGNPPHNNHSPDACVTNVKAYNRELSADEISSAYLNSPAGPQITDEEMSDMSEMFRV